METFDQRDTDLCSSFAQADYPMQPYTDTCLEEIADELYKIPSPILEMFTDRECQSASIEFNWRS